MRRIEWRKGREFGGESVCLKEGSGSGEGEQSGAVAAPAEME